MLLSRHGERLEGSFWICALYSGGILFNSKATSSTSIHLAVHGKFNSGREPQPSNRRNRYTSVLEQQRTAASTREQTVVSISRPLADAFKDAVINWVANDCIPFSMIESPYFRYMMSLVSPGLTESLLPASANTIRAWIDEKFASQLEQLRGKLAASQHRKHISFDGWTSPNAYSLFGVFVHFVDASGKLINYTLGVPRV